MKKMVLGVTAFMAAVPLIGVISSSDTSALVDNLSLTVNEVCSFTRSSGAATKSTTMAMGALDTTMTNTFKVICNNKNGYSVAAVFTKMTGPGADITYSATTPTAGSGTWTATKGAASATANIAGTWQSASSTYTGGTLMSGTGVTTSSGTTQQVTYKVGTAANQAKGNYSATATYTLTQS